MQTQERHQESNGCRRPATSGSAPSALLPAALVLVHACAQAQQPSLVDLSIEELAQIPITSVSRRSEPLATAPSAIQILTGEEIRRSGASRLVEALRLTPNLQVAQLNSNDWSITARGFSGQPTFVGSLANKLLVMIDGRTLYTPVFGGIFWDAQNILLEDIDRIESVSGPGTTLWGVNAVNGVINVIRKRASDTQGWYASATRGARLEDYSLRYGGTVGESGHYRIYGQQLGRDALYTDGRDEWLVQQGGFRVDFDARANHLVTLQGDFYSGHEGIDIRHGLRGQNVMAIWQRRYAQDAEMRLSAYFDHRWRSLDPIDVESSNWDIDFQHSFPAHGKINVVWGSNFRMHEDETSNPNGVRFDPASRRLSNANVFVQGEIAMHEGVALTLGAKVGKNDFSGFEFQPSVRMAWTPAPQHTLWWAISRAVRTPSRLDSDIIADAGLEGNPDFKSEKVFAYELGYRARPTPNATLSVSTFHNEYREIRSLDLTDTPPTLRVANGFDASSWGMELFGMVAVTPRWRLRSFYTFLNIDFTARHPGVAPGAESFEARDPRHQIGLHSMLDLPKHLQLDVFMRRIGSLPASTLPAQPGAAPSSAGVDSYISVDARLGWQKKNVEIALIGQNLNGGHVEVEPQKIPRSVFLRTRLWF